MIVSMGDSDSGGQSPPAQSPPILQSAAFGHLATSTPLTSGLRHTLVSPDLSSVEKEAESSVELGGRNYTTRFVNSSEIVADTPESMRGSDSSPFFTAASRRSSSLLSPLPFALSGSLCLDESDEADQTDQTQLDSTAEETLVRCTSAQQIPTDRGGDVKHSRSAT